MDTETKIRAAMVWLLETHPFWGTLALKLRLQEQDMSDINTYGYATDGTHLFYDPKKMGSHNRDMMVYAVAHEIGHCMFGHPWRRGCRDHERWAYACEHPTNFMCHDAGLSSPVTGIVMDTKYKNMASEQIYNNLPKANESGKVIMCVVGDAPGPSSPGNDPGKSTMSEGAWQVAVKQAAAVAKAYDKLPGALEKLVGLVGESETDWRSYIRRWIQSTTTDDYTWSKPARRYLAQRLYLPSASGTSVGYGVVAIDTSGSTVPLLEPFYRELVSIHQELRPERLDVVHSDCRIQKVDTYGPEDTIELKIKGMGGTDFAPVFKHVEKDEPTFLIYLTDLDGPMPKEAPEYPVLWVVPKGTPGKAPFGEMIYVNPS